MKFRTNRTARRTARKGIKSNYNRKGQEDLDIEVNENEDYMSSHFGLWHWQGVAIMLALYDVVVVNLAYFLSLWLRFDCHFTEIPGDYLRVWSSFAPAYTVICLVVFWRLRLYRSIWRFASYSELVRVIVSSIVTNGLHTILITTLFRRMPITYYVIGAILQFLFVSLIRFGYRILLVEKKKVSARNIPTVPTMIIGAGETARKAIRHLEDTPFRATVVVDEKSAGKSLDGINVVSDFGAALSGVRAVFIADPVLGAEKRKEIKEACDGAGIELQDYTGYLANLGGRIPTSSLLELVAGSVTLVVDGKESKFSSGEEALKSLKDRYDVKSIRDAKIELVKPSSSAYVGYDAWAQQHKEQTGEDVSFF